MVPTVIVGDVIAECAATVRGVIGEIADGVLLV